MTRYLIALLFSLAFLTSHHAVASTCGGTLNPVLVVPTAISFGIYDPTAASDATANGTVTVSCTVQLGNTLPNFTIALSKGGASSFSPRQMSLSQTLNYNIYTTLGHTTVWGDGTGSTVTQSYNSSASLGQTAFTMYGDMPKSQFAPAGIYSDTITVTVTY